MEGCPVCYEELNDNNSTTFGCNHIFCLDCVNKVIDSNNKCPVCRAGITEYYHNNERCRIIVKRVINREQQDGGISIRDFNVLKFKYYIVWLLMVGSGISLFIERYSNLLLNDQLNNCSKYIENITEAINACDIQLSLHQLLVPSYVYNERDRNLMFCQIPQYFINKCFVNPL